MVTAVNDVTSEQAYIEMEAARIDSSEQYFSARPQIDNNDRRKVFESGFDRGWKAALNSQVKSVPEGWKLVPTEPTEDMFFDPDDVCVNMNETPWGKFVDIYKSMLSSAPQPAKEDRVGELEAKYNELIMAVSRKYPNETRHQTALRYINGADARAWQDSNSGKAMKGE